MNSSSRWIPIRVTRGNNLPSVILSPSTLILIYQWKVVFTEEVWGNKATPTLHYKGAFPKCQHCISPIVLSNQYQGADRHEAGDQDFFFFFFRWSEFLKRFFCLENLEERILNQSLKVTFPNVNILALFITGAGGGQIKMDNARKNLKCFSSMWSL